MNRKLVVVATMFAAILLTAVIVPRSTQQGGSTYDPWIDTNDDGTIDIWDLAKVGQVYGSAGTPINKTALLLELQERVESLENTVASQQAQISELQSKLDRLNNTLTSRIEALEQNQSALAQRITALENAVYGSEEVTFLDDKFDTGLDDWSHWGDSGYVLQWVSNTAMITGDAYDKRSGMQKVVDLSAWDGSGVLLLSFDWRATSDTSLSDVTQANVWIQDVDSNSTLYSHALAAGGTTDTGWQHYANDISSYVLGHPRIRLVLFVRDGWITNWHQTNTYDNIKL